MVPMCLLCGLAYKADIDDMRESPSLELIHILKEYGANVDYHDPYIPVVPQTREHPEFAGMKSVEISPENLKSYDAVLIATKHSNVDYRALCENVELVVDSRNATVELFNEFGNKIAKV